MPRDRWRPLRSSPHFAVSRSVADSIVNAHCIPWLWHVKLKNISTGEGVYEYKFLVNGVWFLDSSKPTVSHDDGITNNVLVVKKEDDFEEVTNNVLIVKKSGRDQGDNFDGSTIDVEGKDESDAVTTQIVR